MLIGLIHPRLPRRLMNDISGYQVFLALPKGNARATARVAPTRDVCGEGWLTQADMHILNYEL